MTDLKPCPFCGGFASEAMFNDFKYIMCLNCNVAMGGSDPRYPKHKWNKRHSAKVIPLKKVSSK